MTNKEAIEFLKNMIDREAIGFVCPDREGDVAIWQYHVEALQMAISALQAQDSPKPTAESVQNVQNDDLIVRKAAIDALDSFILDETTNLQGDSVREILESLPSAQPEIIRCKDCENWIPGYITDNDDFIPPKCGKYQQMVGHSSDDYCSLAERRTDEGSD